MATMKKELAKVRSKVNLEPVIDQENYTISLMHATNWYNTNNQSSEYRSWFVQHFKKRIDFQTSVLSDFEYRIAGVIARILANGNELRQVHHDRLESEFQLVRAKALKNTEKFLKQQEESEKQQNKKPVLSAQEKIDEKVKDFLGEFSGLVDQFAIDGTVPNTTALVRTMKIAGPAISKISDKIQRPIAELQEALEGNDKQLNEGYSQYKKSEIKKMLSIYTDLIEKLQQTKVTAPVKIRKQKIIPAGILVKNVKFKPEFPELKLKSISPVQIIGSSELWLYNTKYKKMQTYVAVDGMTLSVKGTTLLNFSIEKSLGKTLRKPEEIANLNNQGKRAFQQFFKAVKSKESALNGRINDECIIMAAFK